MNANLFTPLGSPLSREGEEVTVFFYPLRIHAIALRKRALGFTGCPFLESAAIFLVNGLSVQILKRIK
jgi:hypothetical protein